jgi:hypothetical protein
MKTLTVGDETLPTNTSPEFHEPIEVLISTALVDSKTVVELGFGRSFETESLGQPFLCLYIRRGNIPNPDQGKIDIEGTYIFNEELGVVRKRILKHLGHNVVVKDEKNERSLSMFYFEPKSGYLIKSTLDGIESAYKN